MKSPLLDGLPLQGAAVQFTTSHVLPWAGSSIGSGHTRLPRGGNRDNDPQTFVQDVDKGDALLLHPQLEELFDDSLSQFSTGNFKRSHKSVQDEISSQDSVSQVGEGYLIHLVQWTVIWIVRCWSLKTLTHSFFEVVKEAFHFLPIKNVHFGQREDPQHVLMISVIKYIFRWRWGIRS